jgi:hypothetical protein
MHIVKEVSEASTMSATKEAMVENKSNENITATFDGRSEGTPHLTGLWKTPLLIQVLDVECITKHCHKCVNGHRAQVPQKILKGTVDIQRIL